MSLPPLADAVRAERERHPADRDTGASDADLDLAERLLVDGRLDEVRRFVADNWSLTAELTAQLCSTRR